MELCLENSDGHTIKAYNNGIISIGDNNFDKSLIVSVNQIITEWPPNCFDELTLEHCQTLLDLNPELVLLGTGETQHFPHPTLLELFLGNGIGFECMNTAAACRTYNALISDQRNVVAGLILTT